MRLSLLLAALSLYCCASLAHACVTRLETHSGPVCGLETSTGGRNFVGIPYAAPPVGALRWAAPAPHAGWTEPRDATEYGPGCLQLHHNPDVPVVQDEDCLSLNVYTPPASCGVDLPVLVFFHGGSFEEGGSSLFFYNATVLAENQCLVVVTGNYRLGAFGGILTPELPGNQMLRDQRAVLEWVHTNSDALHINASRVTISGQSAGAMSALSSLVTDFFFRCPARRLAIHASAFAPVYLYRFNHSLEFNFFNKSCCDNQACHGVEMPLVFHALPEGYELDDASEKLSVQMQTMWGNFVRTGTPNSDSLGVTWPAFTADTELDEVLQVGSYSQDTSTDVCARLWDSVNPFWDQPDDVSEIVI